MSNRNRLRRIRCRSLRDVVGRQLEIGVSTAAVCDARLRPELAPESLRSQLDQSRSGCEGFALQKEPCGRGELLAVRGYGGADSYDRDRVTADGAYDGALSVGTFEPGSDQSGRIDSWRRWRLLRVGPSVCLWTRDASDASCP